MEKITVVFWNQEKGCWISVEFSISTSVQEVTDKLVTIETKERKICPRGCEREYIFKNCKLIGIKWVTNRTKKLKGGPLRWIRKQLKHCPNCGAKLITVYPCEKCNNVILASGNKKVFMDGYLFCSLECALLYKLTVKRWEYQETWTAENDEDYSDYDDLDYLNNLVCIEDEDEE